MTEKKPRKRRTKAEMLADAKAKSETKRMETQVPDEESAPNTGDPNDYSTNHSVQPEALASAIKVQTLPYDSLDDALLAAQRSVIGVFKDGRNKHHGFNYTRGESMIKFGRDVFHKFGLSLRTAGNSTRTLGSGQDVLDSKYVLSHPDSKGREEISFSLPIVTNSEKGNPIRTADKAALGAATESLAYVIRDLLAVPRFEKDEDVNADVGATTENFKTPKPEVVGGSKPLFMTDERLEAIRRMILETSSDEGNMLKKYRVKGVSLLNELQYNHAMDYMKAKLVAGNAAAQTGGKVTKVTMTEAPPAPDAGAEPSGEQLLEPGHVDVIKKALEAKKKKLSDLLAHIAYASLETVPVSQLNSVMAWIRN